MAGLEEKTVIVRLPRRFPRPPLRGTKKEEEENVRYQIILEDIGEELNQVKDAIQLLPEEVWRLIFNKLEDWKDLIRCSNTCRLFRMIFQSSHLFKMYALFFQFIPHLYKYLDGSEILCCRAACKAWNAGVDHFFENPRSLRPHDDEDVDPRNPPFVTPMMEKGLGRRYTTTSLRNGLSIFRELSDGLEVYTDGRPMTMEYTDEDDGWSEDSSQWCYNYNYTPEKQFRERYLPRARNPFIGRNVLIHDGCRNVKGFLRAFGRHIWYLTLCQVTPRDYCHSKHYPQLQAEYFKLLPNLRRLRLYGQSYQVDFPEIPLESLTLAPKLEAIHLSDSDCYRGNSYAILLEKYHNQLRRIDLPGEVWKSVFHLGWPKLTELHLGRKFWWLPGGYSDLWLEWHPQVLLKAKVPNLRKLGLSLNYLNDNGASVVQVISALSATTRLNTLRLNSGLPRFTKERHIVPLTVPTTLKTLELEYDSRMSAKSCYAFLAHFPFLENLNMFWKARYIPGQEDLYSGEFVETCDIRLRPLDETARYYRDNNDELCQPDSDERKYLHKCNLYKIRIWRVLPKLKVLTFQRKVYTRERYEWLQRQGTTD